MQPACAFYLCYLLQVFEPELLSVVGHLCLYRHGALLHVSADCRVLDTCAVGQHRKDKYNQGSGAPAHVYPKVSTIPKL